MAASEEIEIKRFYPIGTPGVPWGDTERADWLSKIAVKRSYQDEVVAKVETLKGDFDVEQYGALSHDPARYPLFAVRTKRWVDGRPLVLVTGGVHGYETSGVQGALKFLETEAQRFADRFNIVVVPCVSPWGYETIQRWNRNAEDPNRGFYDGTSRDECAAVQSLVESLGGPDAFTVHLDLHETTDTDETEFTPAKAARDGLPLEGCDIPDGFYLIGNASNPQDDWHAAMIKAVMQVTHVVPDPTIFGKAVRSPGVIASDAKKLSLCKGATNAAYATTTEVYPDSKATPVTDAQCNRAQVACIVAGLDFVATTL